uniref:NFY protein n=1 Tax=Zingiber officinale TaxID=94328 RepID=A0AA50CBQ7_ZINOF|nr:NFY protein [Zingiber officinale]
MAEASSSSTVDGAGSHESGGSVREQDRFLPIANIIRIMKKGLPANAKVAKDAKETMQECVSEFISFVTSEASDRCQKEKRKTINGDDLLWSMATLGFEDYIEPLKLYLQKYREVYMFIFYAMILIVHSDLCCFFPPFFFFFHLPIWMDFVDANAVVVVGGWRWNCKERNGGISSWHNHTRGIPGTMFNDSSTLLVKRIDF